MIIFRLVIKQAIKLSVSHINLGLFFVISPIIFIWTKRSIHSYSIGTLRPWQNGRHFPDLFKWILSNEIRLRVPWSLFLRVQLTIIQHWFGWWRGADHATSHYLHQWWLVYWRIYASFGLNELTFVMMCRHNTTRGVSTVLYLLFEESNNCLRNCTWTETFSQFAYDSQLEANLLTKIQLKCKNF